jgi:predicted RNA-binding Zn-ribbon protein involved in translation (DUF1610 family)
MEDTTMSNLATGHIRSSIRFDHDGEEYVVRVTVAGVPIRGTDGTVEASEYRTDDRIDAMDTAARMVAEAKGVQLHDATITAFECDECGHKWVGIANPKGNGHAWETCPNCGADDGENCWDCGLPTEDEGIGELMCSDCRHTICSECQHRSHTNGREEDGGCCGETGPVM